METLKLEEKHIGTVIDQMLELKSRIDYHKTEIEPNYHTMYAWEEREYRAVHSDCLENLKFLKNLIIENEKVFNKILDSYNLTVSVFINKYILH